MWIDDNKLAAQDRRYRVNFVNGLSGYKSAHLVATVDGKGQTNLAVFSSVFHLGAEPALIGMIVRPDSVARHTLENIRETGIFTLNHVHEGIYHQAHQSAARYPQSISEFEAVGLTPVYREGVAVPFVEEAKVRLLLKLQDTLAIKANGTWMVIGEVQGVEVPENSVSADGAINYSELDEVAVSGLDSYYQTSHITRLSYAKPDAPLIAIEP